ncbi:MAG TPA: alcohol dehydrogenase catalytic domain-containing protein [Bryobacteraceae bacterium]|nr:alcohol dehydrogenase catalytic domain-containing protein [Bryobacteraceae bacterium]
MPALASTEPIPKIMKAAVYHGQSTVAIDDVDVPAIGPGEILIRVESCGICHTDLKKIEYNLLPPPRIFGHETAGVVAAIGEGVTSIAVGQRAAVFHHIPCGDCFYCERKLYAQCPVYKKVGVTAGFEPAGGGFGQYVRVMDWIARRGVVAIPDHITYDQASFIEPVNTCVKAVSIAETQPGDFVLVQGQGPIGLIFTMLLSRRGARIAVTDTIPERLSLGRRFGAEEAWNPREVNVAESMKYFAAGRGADFVIAATSAPGLVNEALASSRPGARILLFAQTSSKERLDVSGADICVGERTLFGSYSADVDLQAESARLVFSGDLPVNQLISHRIPLGQIERGFTLALHPDAQSLKIIVQPQRIF